MKKNAQRFQSVLFCLLIMVNSNCVEDSILAVENIDGSVASISHEQPIMVDQNLSVKTFVEGLISPISMAFLSTDEMLVLEKNTGRVQFLVGGNIQKTVLDLAVNFASERGLLGITLHPEFPSKPWVYLFWTESLSGDDSNILSNTPLLGNRVDRFTWNQESLTLNFDRNIIRLRALQADAGEPQRGNHNGGVIRFGTDGKLYIFIGDVGRRGQLQNLPCGPTAECPGPIIPDDQFGGPMPDNAHLTGAILRLNEDGSTPPDNVFFNVGSNIGGEVGANIQKIFSYGHRNSFGMAIDHCSGDLWLQENGDDSFSELNRVLPGMNGGWIQFMGPQSRIKQYKAIETSSEFFGLQQARWLPTNIADTKEEALERLFMLPNAICGDPAFSWKYEVAPGGLGFINGSGLGSQYDGHLVLGAGTDGLEGGYLFKFKLSGNRDKVAVDDSRINDRVADNMTKHDITESESLLFGKNFGIGTDIQTGPNGNLFVVSFSHGTIYEITKK